jgi:tetratricopeptide (TPR) repeat protein
VRGHCLPYGDGITYWPVTEAALQLADVEVEERVRRPLGAVLGAELQTTPQEIAWAFRKLVEAAAPVAVVFDDVHWGEEAFLDLIEHVALLAARAPILLVCMARPELLDRRPSWPVALRLEPLPQGQVERMIGGRVPDETQTRIVRAAGGNPLFVQELLAMMEADDAEIAVPPNLQALLAARLDQLDPSERRVLEHGSVEGELFHLGAVATLTPEDQNVTGRLASLVRRALVQPDRAQIPDEDGFRFRHLLVRDAAYDSLPKSTRADLHERFSDWLERHGAGLVELDEILGYHLEQAFRFRESLGSPDEALAGRAARHLATAGRRAFARGDMPATINLLERAVALPAGGGGDHRPVGELGDALAQVGELERARELLGEAVEHARVADDPVAMWTSRLTLAWVEENMDATDAPVELEREARAAIAALEDSGDDAALAKAWRLLGEAYNARCQGALWQAALEQAVEHAGRTTDVVEQYLDLWLLGGSMFFGPAPVDQAGARLESLARDFPDPVAQVGILRGLGAVRVQQGRFDEARKLIAEAKETLLDRGLLIGGIGFISGPLEALAGDLAAAEEELRESMASLAALRWTSRGAALAMLLARVLARQHRDGEAEELMEEWSAVTGAMYWLEWDVVRPAIKATILARRGEVEEAERLAREAVAVSVRTDFLNWRADVHLDLAEVLRAAGKSDEARASVEQAVALFEQKGNVVSAGAARALLG